MTSDCDGDGNPNSIDPNPATPTAEDDMMTALPGSATSYDILSNDDFLTGTNTTLTDTGSGTAIGIIDFDPLT